MDMDGKPREGEVPSPGFAGSARAEGWGPLQEPGDVAADGRRARRDGVRYVRRMSNLTAAALVVGTGAAVVALAHHAVPVSAPASVASATGIGGTAAVNGAGGPQVSHSVATTSGSGVVVTTQTKTVNGKVVVTQVRRPAAYHDY